MRNAYDDLAFTALGAELLYDTGAAMKTAYEAGITADGAGNVPGVSKGTDDTAVPKLGLHATFKPLLDRQVSIPMKYQPFPSC